MNTLTAMRNYFGFVAHDRRAGGRGRLKSGDHGLSHGRSLRIEALEQRTLLSVTGLSDLAENYIPPAYNLFELGGYLSESSNGEPLDIAMAYLTSHADSLGISSQDVLNSIITDQYTDSDTGLTHIYLRQEFNGLEVVNANMNVNITADGRVLNVGSTFVNGLSAREDSSITVFTPALAASDALQRVGGKLGLTSDANPMTVVAAANDLFQTTVLQDSDLSLDSISAELQYVATSKGVQLTWNYVLRTPDGEHWYDISADGASGDVLYAGDWIDAASYTVFALPTENPDDGARTTVTDPSDPTASPYGWHDTNGAPGAEYTNTQGNNVSASVNGTYPDGGATLTFDFPLDLTQDPSSYSSASTTNMFYWINTVHDIHYYYGFTEVAGNFQQTNYTGDGLGNDPVLAYAQDPSALDNAFMATPPDGSSPQLWMGIFDLTTPYRDSALESIIIIHEFGHGVSNRLVGGPSNVNALDALQSGGLGEGWSDWWGLMLTQKSTDGKMDSYSIGTYVLGQSPTGGGIRRYPYSYDMSVNPLTYGDYNSSPEVHDAGEIWCSALWDMTWLLIDEYGYTSDIANGYDPTDPTCNGGNNLALQLVMNSLKIMPVSPTFLDGRDALLAADQVLTGGANKELIWTAFARRGMGYSANDGGDANATTVIEAFDLPPFDPIVIAQDPDGATVLPIDHIQLTFSEAIDPTSFAVADDVASFTGPGGVDLMAEITGYTWIDDENLRIDFNPQSTVGTYTMVIGPQILAADNGNPMDQDRDGNLGETPDDQYTATFFGVETFYSVDMDLDPGWTYQGDWAWGTPTGGGANDFFDPESGYTGSNVVGYNLAGDYPDNMTQTVYVTTGAIDCTRFENVTLSFYRWLDVESSMYDHASIQVSNDGTTWYTVWSNTGGSILDSSWSMQAYNISAYADDQPAVYIRWGMGSTDSSVVFPGWNIDDLALSGTPLYPDVIGPKVTDQTPIGQVGLYPSAVQFSFSETMDTASFNVADDVASFTGPWGDDLKSQITGYTWIDAKTLEVQFAAQMAMGNYSLVIGPDITDNGPSFNPMDQNNDGINGAPDDSYTANFEIVGAIYYASMDFDPGWTYEGQWAWGVPTGEGSENRDPLSGSNGSNVIGYNLTGDYSNYMTSPLYATTQAIDCTGYESVTLSFYRWLGVESSSFDHASVEVSNDGVTWHAVWSHDTESFSEDQWSLLYYNISDYADDQPTVYVRWGMGTTDGATTYPGWNIDDVLLIGNPMGLDVTGPSVTGHAPVARIGSGQDAVRFTFSEIMDTSSFNVAFDVVSFTSPAGDDLKSQIIGFTWIDTQTLEVQFASQSAPGGYALIMGPGVTDNGPSFNLMDQNNDGSNGEPDDSYTATFQIGETIYFTGMESNPGWTYQGLWAWGMPSGAGSHNQDPLTGYTGSRVVGYNLFGNYPSNMMSTAYATTGPINCTGYENVALSFYRWLGVESSSFDHASVEVSNDGVTWHAVWDHSGNSISESGWSFAQYDISTYADGKPTVFIRWGMGTTDGGITYPGWNIDDVTVTGTIATGSSASPTPPTTIVFAGSNVGVWDTVGDQIWWYLDANGDGTPDTTIPYGWKGSTPIVGDWNGDGKGEVGVWDTVGDQIWWYLDTNGDNSLDAKIAYGWKGSTPIVGDWSGDGRSDVGIWDAAGDQIWWYLDTNGDNGLDTKIAYGWKGSTPIVGDWSGDGKSDVGIWDAAGDQIWWYLDTNGDRGLDAKIAYGWKGSTPIVGDWNGDGKSKVGVRDLAGDQILWYLDTNGDRGLDATFAYGWKGSTPLAAKWTTSEALLATGVVASPAADVASLTQSELQPIISEAIARWAAAGLDAATLEKLARVQFVIGDLSGSYLGRAEADRIYLDVDAAGHGWFVDSTPALDEEFAPPLGRPWRTIDPRAVDRMDLLTVVEHELGHVAGLADVDFVDGGLMSAKLGTSVRRTPGASERDAVLAGNMY